MMGYRPPQYRRGLKPFGGLSPFFIGYRPPQYRRGLKLTVNTVQDNMNDIDHPNIEGD